MKALVLPSSAILAVALLVACGGGNQAGYFVTPQAAGQGTGREAPDFQITTYQGEEEIGGQEVKLSDLLAQGRPVVLNLWAGLCPPCRAEMPELQEVYEEYRGRILLFGLDVGPFTGLGSREDGRALLKELGITYPNGITFDGDVVTDYRVLGMPTTFFINPDGETFTQWAGLLNKSKMVEWVEDLLRSTGDS